MEAKRRGPFELSTDARILYNVLEKGLIKEKKDMVSYKELSSAISRNVQKEARGLLGSARKNIESDFSIMLEVVKNEGVKLTDDCEGALDYDRNHIKRLSARTIKRVTRALNGKDVSPQLAAKLSIHNMFGLFTKSKAPQKLIEHIENKKVRELSTAETLKLFNNGQTKDKD